MSAEPKTDMYEYENEIAAARGFETWCGTDEAGRGPLAGPVYAAAVRLTEPIAGLNDSKKLSEKRRDELFDIIIEKADWAVCSSDVDQIERTDILAASMDAMNRAVSGLCEKLAGGVQPGVVLVDGNIIRGFDIPAIPVVGGDMKCASIAAASILAKVSRDREMLRLAEIYPEYRFEKHKGYATKLHYEMIDRHGLCPEHRPSFLKKHFAKSGILLTSKPFTNELLTSKPFTSKPFTSESPTNAPPAQPFSAAQRGNSGERLACEYLERLGQQIVRRNFRTRYGEIDIISADGEFTAFVEVKLRDNPGFAEAMEFVDERKRHRIRSAAAEWLADNAAGQPRFDVLEIYLPRSSRECERFNYIRDAFQ